MLNVSSMKVTCNCRSVLDQFSRFSCNHFSLTNERFPDRPYLELDRLPRKKKIKSNCSDLTHCFQPTQNLTKRTPITKISKRFALQLDFSEVSAKFHS